jgi:hypothetical protein
MSSGSTADDNPFLVHAPLTLLALKQQYCQWILIRANGNKTEAARMLEIDRSSLYRLLRPGQQSGMQSASDVRRYPPSALTEPGSPLPEGREANDRTERIAG